MSIRTMTMVAMATTALGLLTPMAANAQRGGGQAAPDGSYFQSCNAARVDGGRLYAQCRDIRGNRRPTSVDLSACRGSDIANDNGLLVCGGQRGRFENDGGGSAGPGGGGWNGRNTITVYRDSNYRGQSATFQGEVYNLADTGLNDAISSMQFRGEWEACTDANFRGQCQVFSDDVRNLDRWGMNDRISSLRPVRGGRR